MADIISRLKVDSTEYDSKIKRAAQGLTHLAESARNSGAVLRICKEFLTCAFDFCVKLAAIKS